MSCELWHSGAHQKSESNFTSWCSCFPCLDRRCRQTVNVFTLNNTLTKHSKGSHINQVASNASWLQAENSVIYGVTLLKFHNKSLKNFCFLNGWLTSKVTTKVHQITVNAKFVDFIKGISYTRFRRLQSSAEADFKMLEVFHSKSRKRLPCVFLIFYDQVFKRVSSHILRDSVDEVRFFDVV